MNSELTQKLKDAAMSNNPYYILNTIGIYSYLFEHGNKGFRPNMTVEQMMSNFRNLENNNFNFEGRPNGFIESISYNFNDSSYTPPSAKQRPLNGLRTITDGQAIGDPKNGINTVWQYYRSVITLDINEHLSTVRLFNTPIQNSYQNTPVNQNLSSFLPVGTTIAAYLVTWRIIGIDFKQDPVETVQSNETKEKIAKRFASIG